MADRSKGKGKGDNSDQVQNRSAAIQNRGLDAAAKELTLSQEFISAVPPNVRDWKTEHAQLWLAEIFPGAEDLPKYQEQAKKAGVIGVDLLALSDDHIEAFGITMPLHKGRIKTCVAQLITYQSRLDDVAEEELEAQKNEKAFFELETKCNELMKAKYELPPRMTRWEPIDVFIFLKRPEFQENLSTFLKPIAMRKLDGKELIELAQNGEKALNDTANAPNSNEKNDKNKNKKVEQTALSKALDLGADFNPEERDVRRFVKLILDYRKKLLAREQNARKDSMREAIAKLPAFPKDNQQFKRIHKLGAGNFGVAYFAEFERRKVVVKMTLSHGKNANKGKDEEGNDKKAASSPKQAPAAAVAPKPAPGVAVGKVMSVQNPNAPKEAEEELILKPTPQEDLEYEARMLLKAEGRGILQLLAVDLNMEKVRIMTEFMCHLSVDRELHMADRNDTDSIFHPFNELNKAEKENNGVENPVLLQMVRIARDVASALAHLHSEKVGVLHLDISARNILLDAAKRPKIGDFGLSTIEKDMQEMYEFRGKLIEKYGHGKDFDMEYKAAIREEKKYDEDIIRRNYMYMEVQRPLRWMPDWLIDCGTPAHPKIDQSVDIYSFGCFMYELATRRMPHQDDTPEEVARLKKARQGNPPVPPGLNDTFGDSMDSFGDIMSDCWEQDHQRPMSVMAERLAKLHKDIAKGSHQESDMYEDLKRYTDANIVNNVRSSEYGKVGEAESNIKSNMVNGKLPEHFMPKVKGEENIALKNRTDTEVNETGQLGGDTFISKVKFMKGLEETFHARDQIAVAKLMRCVVVSHGTEQVEAIAACLTKLSELFDDVHGFIDDDGDWAFLCDAILTVVDEATQYNEKATQSKINHAQLGKLYSHVLDAIARLLNRKFPEEKSSEGGSRAKFEERIRSIIINGLKDIKDDQQVCAKAAFATAFLACRSIPSRKELHRKGAVGLLLDAIARHNSDDSVVFECVKALLFFDIEHLIDPRPVQLVDAKGKPTGPTEKIDPALVGGLLKKQWGEVFESIYGAIQRVMSKPNLEDDEVSMTVLQLALQALFQSCECQSSDEFFIERFLYTVPAGAVTLLASIVKRFPDNFRIQEGAIGILSYILDTGVALDLNELLERNAHQLNNILNIRMEDEHREVKPVLAQRDRLDEYLNTDPGLALLLTAMEKFRIDNRSILTPRQKRTSTNMVAEYATSHGVYDTLNRSAASSTIGRGNQYGGNEYARRQQYYSNMDGKVTRDVDPFEAASDSEQFFDIKTEAEFEVDSEGEQLTAAPLQKSVAMIIGRACNLRVDVQQNLLRTRYNELILLSFQNFRSNVALIRYGCYAMYNTCRCNALHQKMLRELGVFRHLISALLAHRSMWEVLDAVLFAVIGLLEPSEDVSNLSEVKELMRMQQELLANKNIGVANIQATAAGLMSPQQAESIKKLQDLLSKRKQLFDGYHISNLITNAYVNDVFGRKVTLMECLALLVAEFQMNEKCFPLAGNFLKLMSSVLFWNHALLDKWSKEPFVDLGITYGLVTKANNKRRSIGFNAKAGEYSAANRDDNTDYMVKGGFPMRIGLLRYVHIALLWNGYQPFILTTSLRIIVAVLRQQFSIGLQFGSEVPANVGAILVDYRAFAFLDGVMHYFLKVVEDRDLEDRILVRYVLWVFLLLITDSQPDPKKKEAVVSFEKYSSTEGISAEIAIKGGIEWTVRMLQLHKKCYTIQAIGVMFLIWMERHGRFANRDAPLREMQTLLTENTTRKFDDGSFIPVEEEGFDAYLLGKNIELLFGNVGLSSNRLLRLVESHLGIDNIPPELKIGGGVSTPIGAAAAGGADSPTPLSAVPLDEGDAQTGKLVPKSVTITSIEVEEDQTTYKPYSVFVIKVEWDDNIKWNVSRRFRRFLQLQDDLDQEFGAFSQFYTTRLSPALHGQNFTVHSPDFLGQRRAELQQWLTEVVKVRASLNSKSLISFLDIPETVQTFNRVPIAPVVANTERPPLPVNDVQWDTITGLVFIGCGSLAKATDKEGLAPSNTVVGMLCVHKMECDGASYRFPRTTSINFAAAVVSVAWDRVRRCLMVGLNVGPILFFHLSESAAELTYCGEVDAHHDIVTNMLVVPDGQIMLNASKAGPLTIYNMKDGQIVTQSLKSGAKFTCIAFDRVEHMAFCGTTMGTVQVFDLRKHPPNLLDKLPLPHPWFIMNIGEVTSVEFHEETRLLFASLYNHIHIYKIKGQNGMVVSTDYFLRIDLHRTARISKLMLLHRGMFLVACTAEGTAAMYDLSDEPKRQTAEQQITKAAERAGYSPQNMASASKNTLLSTTASGLISWQEVIKRSNAAMRDWLRAKGVDASLCYYRADLLRLIAQASNIKPADIANVLQPKRPRTDVVAGWNFNPLGMAKGSAAEGDHSISGKNSPVRKKITGITVTQQTPFIGSCTFLELEGVLAFGCMDGKVYFVKVAELLPPVPPGDKIDMERIRAQLLDVNFSPRQEIKASMKSSRGKRQIMSVVASAATPTPGSVSPPPPGVKESVPEPAAASPAATSTSSEPPPMPYSSDTA